MKFLKNCKGQSLVEFTIMLPLLLLLIMGIVEFGIMLNSYLTISNAAREGARAGIIGESDTEIKNIIISRASGLKEESLNISITPSEANREAGKVLSVNVTYEYHATVPIISGIFSGGIMLDAQNTMRVE